MKSNHAHKVVTHRRAGCRLRGEIQWVHTLSCLSILGGEMQRKSVGILDTDSQTLDDTLAWIAAHAPELDATIHAGSWGELLTSAKFPPDAVVLYFRPTDRVNIAYESRVCRILDIEVLVIVGDAGNELPPKLDGVGARVFCDLGDAAAALGAVSAESKRGVL